jgi:hypothetical protein
MVTGLSLHNQGATMIRINYTELGIPNHTTYVAFNPCLCQPFTQILQNVNRSVLPWSTVLLHPASLPIGYTLLTPSPTPSAQLSFHVWNSQVHAYCGMWLVCKVSTTTSQSTERSLSDTDGRHFLLNVRSSVLNHLSKLGT